LDYVRYSLLPQNNNNAERSANSAEGSGNSGERRPNHELVTMDSQISSSHTIDGSTENDTSMASEPNV